MVTELIEPTELSGYDRIIERMDGGDAETHLGQALAAVLTLLDEAGDRHPFRVMVAEESDETPVGLRWQGVGSEESYIEWEEGDAKTSESMNRIVSQWEANDGYCVDGLIRYLDALCTQTKIKRINRSGGEVHFELDFSPFFAEGTMYEAQAGSRPELALRFLEAFMVAMHAHGVDNHLCSHYLNNMNVSP